MRIQKKAVGARPRCILTQFLIEAATIGVVGGSVGYLLGLGLTSLVNAGAGAHPVFLVTPRLNALAIGFAVAMAAASGLIPAVRARSTRPCPRPPRGSRRESRHRGDQPQ